MVMVDGIANGYGECDGVMVGGEESRTCPCVSWLAAWPSSGYTILPLVASALVTVVSCRHWSHWCRQGWEDTETERQL